MMNLLTVKFAMWNCFVMFSKYENDRIAMVLRDINDGLVVAKATVNMSEVELPDGYVFIKDWNENRGMLDTLMNAEIIGPPELTISTGHVAAHMCPLLVNPEEYDG